MLSRAVDTFIAGVELVEAEGRVLRDHAAGFTRHASGLLAFALLGVAGILTACIGLTLLLAQAVGLPLALCLMGVAAGGIGIAGWMWCASGLTGDDRRPDPRRNGTAR